MIKQILRAKHWQVFLVLVGIPFLFQMIFMGITMNDFAAHFENIEAGNPPDQMVVFEQLTNMFKFFPLIMLVFTGIHFIWVWSMGMGLQEKIPNHIDMKTQRFKFAMCFLLAYMLLFMAGIGYVFSNVFEQITLMEQGDPPFDPGLIKWFVLIVPFHFIAMFCSFYLLYFMAKTYKTVELQRAVSFSDFIGEIFLFWLYFIGIWILQPKINEFIDNDELPLAEEPESIFNRDY